MKLLVQVAACLLLVGCLSKRSGQEPRSPQDTFSGWASMQTPVDIARARVAPEDAGLLKAIPKKLARGEYGKVLTDLDRLQDQRWAQVLSGHLAGLHTRICAQGQWLYLGQKQKDPPRISMLKLLDALDRLAGEPSGILVHQAIMARARVLLIARDCPGARTVQTRAQTTLVQDLETLVARQKDKLPPDLAYAYAMHMLESQRPDKARLWLERASAQGFDDARVKFALAQTLFELQEFKRAQPLAVQSAKALASIPAAQADAWALAARSSFRLGQKDKARAQLALARKAWPQGALAISTELLWLSQDPSTCPDAIATRLRAFWGLSWRDASPLLLALDRLMVAVDHDGDAAMRCTAQALVWQVDDEQDLVLRGIRYFYAATLDARLGNLEQARGRALIARTELQEAKLERWPVPARELAEALAPQLED